MKKIISTLLIITLLAVSVFSLIACDIPDEPLGTGASKHYGQRSVNGKTLRYAKIAVAGYGSILLLLEESTAPITVNNFLDLANSGFYDNLTFHRVIANFMIQGGDPLANGTGGADKDIVGEFLYNGYYNDLSHLYGTISMARSGNSYNSASSQFFICNADAQLSLDYLYASFGYVIAGMSVVEAITNDTAYLGQYQNGAISDKNLQPVIRRIREISYAEACELVPSLKNVVGEVN